MSWNCTLTTTDIDEYRIAVRPTTEVLTVTGRGRFSASLTRLELHNLRMQRFSESLPRAWDLRVPPARTAIAFTIGPGHAVRWRGTEISENEVIPLHAGETGWHALPRQAYWGSISLPNERLTEASIALLGYDATPPRNAVALAVLPSALQRLRRLHSAAGQLAETAPEIVENHETARGLEQALTEAMLACLDTSGARECTAALRRHATIMRRFHSLMEARADEALFLPEICKAIGVNERTFYLCCQEQLGVSPKRYLLLRRLQLVRQALRVATRNTANVTEIATQYGFWELGRFAVYYRGVFGESPSATLGHPPP